MMKRENCILYNFYGGWYDYAVCRFCFVLFAFTGNKEYQVCNLHSESWDVSFVGESGVDGV